MENKDYIFHLRPNIDIQFEGEEHISLKACNEFKKIIKDAIKTNKILTKFNVKLKYIDTNEIYVYKKKTLEEKTHPNFLKLD